MSNELKTAAVAQLKEKGLDVAEDALASLVSNGIDALEACEKYMTNPLVKLAVTALVAQKAAILTAIDKIDGEDDAGR